MGYEEYTEQDKDNVLEMARKIQEERQAVERAQQEEKRKMKFGKRALLMAYTICATLLVFTMAMIYLEKDSSSLGILATAGVGILPVMYGIYDYNNTKINLKHMDENYIEDYDNKNNIY